MKRLLSVAVFFTRLDVIGTSIAFADNDQGAFPL